MKFDPKQCLEEKKKRKTENVTITHAWQQKI